MSENHISPVVPKPLTFALLRLLADGKFHSGEVLARGLGVSRTSVSNALCGAEQYGLSLFSVRGRGYCLNNAPQLLDAELINKHLADIRDNFTIKIVDCAASSNSLLMQQAAKGAPSGSVLAVEWQSEGRGRLGRPWHSGLGNALTFSLLWRFDCGLAGLSGLSLATGVACVRTLKNLGVSGASLKWPNDILGETGKIAGILSEAQGDMLGPSFVVIGIGINITLPHQVQRCIEQPASALSLLTEKLPERNLLLGTLLRELSGVLKEFSSGGFAALHEEWESYHLYQAQQVQLLLPDTSIVRGVVRGVNMDGALKVEVTTEDGKTEMRVFHAGEISLRGQHHVVV